MTGQSENRAPAQVPSPRPGASHTSGAAMLPKRPAPPNPQPWNPAWSSRHGCPPASHLPRSSVPGPLQNSLLSSATSPAGRHGPLLVLPLPAVPARTGQPPGAGLCTVAQHGIRRVARGTGALRALLPQAPASHPHSLRGVGASLNTSS